MEKDQELQKVLEQVERTSRTQTRYAKLQCLFSAVAALCFGGFLLVVISLLPQVNQAVEEIQNVAQQAQGLAEQAGAVLTDLETVSRELAAADLAGMVADVDTLVVSSQEGVTQALEKLDAVDIEALNKAIANLSAVVEPLAKFFKVFQ